LENNRFVQQVVGHQRWRWRN